MCDYLVLCYKQVSKITRKFVLCEKHRGLINVFSFDKFITKISFIFYNITKSKHNTYDVRVISLAVCVTLFVTIFESTPV